MPATYEPIATTTLGTATGSITFSSITSAYTDLRVVVNAIGTATGDPWFRLNSIFASSYSYTEIGGNGASASSYSVANDTKNYINLIAGGIFTTPTMYTIDLFSYAGSIKKVDMLEKIIVQPQLKAFEKLYLISSSCNSIFNYYLLIIFQLP
jgi:hypothetical protein